MRFMYKARMTARMQNPEYIWDIFQSSLSTGNKNRNTGQSDVNMIEPQNERRPDSAKEKSCSALPCTACRM